MGLRVVMILGDYDMLFAVVILLTFLTFSFLIFLHRL